MPSDRMVPMLDEQILTATLVAAEAHRMQVDKSGAPYISHPMRVAFRVPDRCKPVALLHDVIEDTDMTTHDLLRAGVDRHIVSDIEVLSKRYSYPKETNRQYQQRILDDGNVAVLTVKLADVTDNLDPRRGWVPPPDMRQSYINFRKKLIRRICTMFDVRLVVELQDLGTIHPHEVDFRTPTEGD